MQMIWNGNGETQLNQLPHHSRILRVNKEDTETNLADILTKLLSHDRAKELLSFLYDY